LLIATNSDFQQYIIAIYMYCLSI